MKIRKRLLEFILCVIFILLTISVVSAQGMVDLREQENIESSSEVIEMQESDNELETEIASEDSNKSSTNESIESEEVESESDEVQDVTIETAESSKVSDESSESSDDKVIDYEKMSKKMDSVSKNSMQLSSLLEENGVKTVVDETFGGKIISVEKSWKGDETTVANRPDTITFELYASNSKTAIATLQLSKDNVLVSGSNTWKGSFEGKYPLYDDEGNEITYTVKEVSVTMKDSKGNAKVYPLDSNQTVTYPVYKNGSLIESPIYRCVQDSDDTSTVEGYENVSVFVPVKDVEEGNDYLVVSGNSGNVNAYRAEAYQTDKMIATADGDISAITNGQVIEGVNSDGTTTNYRNYILIADDETGAAVGNDGKYLTDYMTWRAQLVTNNKFVLASNFYRLCGLVENNNENKYPGYMSTAKDKGYGLCLYKNAINSLSNAPVDTQFTYDSSSGGFKSLGSDKIVYLYKKISLAKGTLENKTETFGFTNWKNSSTSDDPMDTGDASEPEPYTNVSVNKVWSDGENHTGETVTIALYANGTEKQELTLSSANDWKGVFSALPTLDSDGNKIVYTVLEKSVKDSSGNKISYISTIADTTNPKEEKSKIWLPVDRPSKKDGGEDYIVVAFPTSQSEIGQNIWGNGSATRKALTSNVAGTKFAMGSKNSGNTDGASMDVVVTEGPVTVGGKTYTNYITDDQAHNADGSLRTTIMWRVGYVGTASADVASHADYGPWPRDLFYFQALAGKGGYLSTQGSLTLENSIDTKKFENNRSLFAYGMMYSSEWKAYSSMIKQGYTKDQITHMIGAMNHYALRSDKSPGQFGESDCTYPAMYLYKGVEITNKSFTITNTEKKKITVKKVWDDNNNKDNKRPLKISVELIKNGVSTGKILYLSEETNWTAIFSQLDTSDADGNMYSYTIKEHVSNPESYDTTYEMETDDKGNKIIKITNKLKATMEIPVKKVWADGNDNHSDTKVEVQLLADGINYENSKITLSKENNWEYVFKDLPKYQEDGKTEIQYTVEETKIPGYTATVQGDMSVGYTITNTPVIIEVPETGRNTRQKIMLLGIGLLIGGTLLMINNKKRGVIMKK